MQGFVKLQPRLPACCCELMFARKHLNKWNTWIPEQVRCRPEDTADSLCRRLADCCWLDSLQVPRGGCGPGYVALNTTTYASPRRVSWSVVVRPQHVDADGDEVHSLFAYTHVGSKPEDVHARAMPFPVFDLGLQLWEAAFPVLSTESQLHPPTACQMLLYYDLFGQKTKTLGVAWAGTGTTSTVAMRSTHSFTARMCCRHPQATPSLQMATHRNLGQMC